MFICFVRLTEHHKGEETIARDTKSFHLYKMFHMFDLLVQLCDHPQLSVESFMEEGLCASTRRVRRKKIG